MLVSSKQENTGSMSRCAPVHAGARGKALPGPSGMLMNVHTSPVGPLGSCAAQLLNTQGVLCAFVILCRHPSPSCCFVK